MNELALARRTMRQYPHHDEVDAVVIGTGAGGAPILATLAAAGLRVIALEAGPWFESPADDFPTDESAANIYWTDERLSAGDTPIVFGANNSGTGVGGSMLHWGAFVPRADPRDLRLHSESGEGVDWPLSYQDLLPHYEELESFLGVSGPANYPWDSTRRYPGGPIPINGPGQLMQRGFEALGLRTSAAPIAALSSDINRPEYGHRSACVNRGFCHQGCRNGAKASMDVTYLPWAVKSGAEIRPHSFVHGFERDARGQITAVLYRHTLDGSLERQRCRAVFLCAGAVETPRLLLFAGLANSSGQVGRNFMSHVATQVWGTFDEPVRMNKGFPATIISEDLLRPDNANFPSGYITQSLGVVPVTWAQGVARERKLFGEDLVHYLDRYNSVAGIGINGDCLPSKQNFLELSDAVDTSGLPKPLVHFSYGCHELAMGKHAEALMTAAWQAAGASDCWTLQRTAHIIGTCRMGHSPTDSVVDSFGHSHDVANLYVCDNSVFPSALAANPALTIMALALRTANHFLSRR
ncbi:choline dehydrogenase-like flavoprotein [Granulicella aggregans]|uniref:Choline dehydrogenase-like flavoprotein n=1 Tax=Granulicella aggregans TaxID=474949 RepID=A0A7W7ZG61_9BACT|nr:GMC family oxidoreductase [Granulicella aggregans]MBB5059128.1 choline dehydrogenase-like flavoprotein [Granulicella aggregans]